MMRAMKINIDNYEAWLLDYLEGNLGPEDTALLLEFMALNPDLRPDFDEIKQIVPEPAPAFSEKIFLKKTGIAEIDDMDAFERTCILAVESQLDKKDKHQFDSYLLQHPQKRKTYEQYAKTHLMPDESIVFNNKSKLKHLQISKGRVIVWSSVAAAAASVIILLFSMPADNPDKVVQKVINLPKNEVVAVQKTAEAPVLESKQIAKMLKNPKKEQFAQKTDTVEAVNKNLREEEIVLEPILAIEAKPLENIEAEIVAHLPVQYLKTNMPVGVNEQYAFRDITLPELVSNRFNEFIKDKSIANDNVVNFWSVANFALKKINQAAGTDLKLKKAYDEKNGKVIYVMKTDLFSFYREKQK